MKKVYFFLLFFPLIYSQNQFHSPENIKLFADFLFCDEDYLRAAFEYERLSSNDTIQFRTALAYSLSGNYKNAENLFEKLIKNSSGFPAKDEYYKSIFLQEDYQRFRDIFYNKKENIFSDNLASRKLYYFSYFFSDSALPELNQYHNLFSEEERSYIRYFYEWKKDPPYKSPVTAAVLSAIIPGTGKFYTGEIGDGIAALISTGLFAFLAYDNFKADHDFRAWLFTGISALFYTGNIYGSAASAQIYNAGIKFNFENELKVYLEERNYYSPGYNFCK